MPPLKTILVVAAVLVVAGVGVARFARPARSASGPGAACRRLNDTERRACYTRLLSERLTTGGVADAVETLNALVATAADVAEHEHEYAHGIGIEAYGRSRDVVPTFVACGDKSASGCRHGVMQAYFEARDHVSAADVEDLCGPFRQPTYSRALLFQCIHGMGHGLTMFRGHDAPRALADCDMLHEAWDQTSCYGGVFMETFINATTPHHPASQLAAQSPHHHAAASFKAVDPDDPLYPCSIMAQRYLYSCYQIQTSVILHLNGGDIGAAARVCDRAPADMRSSCYESLGRDATAYAARDARKTARLCAKGTAPYRPACNAGAVKSLVNWTATTDNGFTFCRIVANDMPEGSVAGPSCYVALGEAIGTLIATVAEREGQCTRARDPAAVAACRQGAGLR